MRLVTWLVLTALLAAMGARAQETPKPPPEEKTAQTDSISNPSNTQVATADAEYKIGPQDVLRIDVWKEPELSRDTPVRPDGKISLPLLNDVQAAGLTAMQLASVINIGLRKYITNPQVTVSVTQINSRRVYVTGEVTRPGTFPLLPGMTVLQALTTSGGFTPFARVKSIYVLRTENGKQVKHPFNYKQAVNGKRPEENILLEPGDVIVVP
jgi:polysaccharide biosynthesis/export protein